VAGFDVCGFECFGSAAVVSYHTFKVTVNWIQVVIGTSNFILGNLVRSSQSRPRY
jgi:hypothetical protein